VSKLPLSGIPSILPVVVPPIVRLALVDAGSKAVSPPLSEAKIR
jgi:hypothetical protein